jgi:hypothetical protein
MNTNKPAIALAALAAVAGATVAAAPMSRGYWIWTSGPSNPHNLHAYFRKTFAISGAPSMGVVRITADSRYEFYVNGRRVSRGPARSHTRWMAYETVDVAPYLRSGPNVFAVMVQHYGEWTFRSQVGRAGFLMEADVQAGGTAVQVQTDASWKCLPSEAWDTSVPRMDKQLAFPDVFDARKEPRGWIDATFDDSSWAAPVVIGPANVAPWTDLGPSGIPSPTEIAQTPAAVVDVASVRETPPASYIDFLPLFDRQGWAVAYATTCIFAPTKREVDLQFGCDDAGKLWLDGVLVLGRGQAGRSAPAQMAATVLLKPGWHRVTAKVVQMLGPWSMYFGVAGSGANGLVLSSEKDKAKPGTWRVSKAFEFDGTKGISAGFETAYAPEKTGPASDWKVLDAPIRPLRNVAAVLRCQMQRSEASAVTGARTLVTAQPSAVFQTKNGADGAVLLDMGREVFGYPRVTVKGARGGEIIDMGYGEALEGPDGAYVSPKSGGVGRLNPEHNDVAYADRFICRAGVNTFEPVDKRGFRYWEIAVRNAVSPVTLTEATVSLSTYPVTNRGSFECSDPLLNRIWETGRWTLQLNMDDSYTDCPWRERGQWWGDARIEFLANCYAFGDAALMRRALLQAAESQDAEGVVHGIFPTDWDGARLPSFSLMWVTSLWEYYLYTGDSTLLSQLLPSIDRLMAFFQMHLDAKLGLLRDVPYWVFIDWAPGLEVQRWGVSGSLNALYYRALSATADIARAAGDGEKADRYAARAAAVKAAINVSFWLPAEHVYSDLIDKDQATGRISQHMSSLVVDLGIAPPARWADTMRRTDTDPQSIKIGSPYFASFYLNALYAMGRDQDALAYIRKNWGAMLDWGATTFWEKWEPTDSLCHAWSACPTRDLPAEYLGVRPVAPGWKQWEMAPAFCDLSWAKGVVPTPQGDIKAAWTRENGGIKITISAPAGTTATVRVPLKGLEQARWKVDGRLNSPSYAKVEKTDAFWTVAFSLAGEHEITAVIPAS